jgi:EAL domain-containing protein (putative c-di-GMP-specific phosphodiesterase class I)/CheY-like chemotaxis protein
MQLPSNLNTGSMTETPAPSPTEISGGQAVAAPPLAPSGTPLCYVVDEDPSIRHFLSLVLHGSGVDTKEFADGGSMRSALESRAPDIVFQNISLDSADAIETVTALGKQGFRGAVQLMSNRGAAVLEHVKSVGVRHNLNMLSVLKKPFETDAIVNILQEAKLGMPPTVATRIELDESLVNNWIEFWYQPKIDLRRKRLAGAEAYPRARHPQHGIVLPEAFLPGSSDSTLIKLSELALTSALKAGLAFSRLGINLPISVNIQASALINLPVADIVKTHRPGTDKWAGLIIDVPEEQIITELALAAELAQRFEPHNVRLAIDDFGHGASALAQVDKLPFAELKLDRKFVTDSGTDKVNAPLCKTAINLAHKSGRAAVALGIEKAADAVALVSMGCDFGQGFLLGQPMPEERFVSLLRQRASPQGHGQ